jgi:hypothetical protein
MSYELELDIVHSSFNLESKEILHQISASGKINIYIKSIPFVHDLHLFFMGN